MPPRSRNRKSTARPGSTPSPIVAFRNLEEWSRWLGAHHAASRGVWIQLSKKGSGRESVGYMDAIEGALMWGWIDAQRKSLDEASFLQRFTPRGKRSIWSKINREKAEALMASRKMKLPGLAEVERAKRDGRWAAAYDSQKTASVPEDLGAALSKNRRAHAFFSTLDSKNRYSILFRIHQAKKAETRAARIARFVAMLAKHEKIHP